MKDIDNQLNKMKILLLFSGMYFGFAILVEILLILRIGLSNLKFSVIDNLYRILDNVNEGVWGLFFVGFVILFVLMIVFANLSDKSEKNDKQQSNENITVKYKITKSILFINIVFAFVWFSVVQNKVGGTPQYDGEKYSVYYRTEFIKNITEDEYFQYCEDKAEVKKYIFSSIFLLFSGLMFLSIMETYKDVVPNIGKRN